MINEIYNFSLQLSMITAIKAGETGTIIMMKIKMNRNSNEGRRRTATMMKARETIETQEKQPQKKQPPRALISCCRI